MGMTAEVLAIGPFHPRLLPFLAHAPERYASTREGAVLIVSVIQVFEGTSRSLDLARCLDVEPWNFATHAFDPARVDLDQLRISQGPLRGAPSSVQ